MSRQCYNEKRREMRAMWKEEGVCVSCGNRPALEELVLCEPCKERTYGAIKRRKDKNRAAGLCPDCGSPTMAGRNYCEECITKGRERSATEEVKEQNRARRAWKRENGICLVCSNKAVPGLTNCETCQYKYLAGCHLGGAANWEKIRDLLETQGHRCALSGVPIDLMTGEVDHIVPKAKGGEDVIENLQWTHHIPNRMKRDMPLDELYMWATKFVEYRNN